MTTKEVVVDDEATVSISRQGNPFVLTSKYKLQLKARAEKLFEDQPSGLSYHTPTSHTEEYNGDASVKVDGNTTSTVPMPFNISMPLKASFNGKASFKRVKTFEINYDLNLGKITNKKKDCWAVALTIMKSWEDQASHGVPDVVNTAGEPYSDMWQGEKGFPISDEKERKRLFDKFNLEPIAASMTPCELLKTLHDYGPIMIEFLPTPSKLDWLRRITVSSHWAVIVGIKDTGNIEDSQVFYIDPTPDVTDTEAKPCDYSIIHKLMTGQQVQIPDPFLKEWFASGRMVRFKNMVSVPQEPKEETKGACGGALVGPTVGTPGVTPIVDGKPIFGTFGGGGNVSLPMTVFFEENDTVTVALPTEGGACFHGVCRKG